MIRLFNRRWNPREGSIDDGLAEAVGGLVPVLSAEILEVPPLLGWVGQGETLYFGGPGGVAERSADYSVMRRTRLASA